MLSIAGRDILSAKQACDTGAICYRGYSRKPPLMLLLAEEQQQPCGNSAEVGVNETFAQRNHGFFTM
jgi:hypothetical protein